MFKFFNIRKTGLTDLTWDERNSADYLYRPADLNASKTPPQESSSKKRETTKKAKEVRRRNKVP